MQIVRNTVEGKHEDVFFFLKNKPEVAKFNTNRGKKFKNAVGHQLHLVAGEGSVGEGGK